MARSRKNTEPTAVNGTETANLPTSAPYVAEWKTVTAAAGLAGVTVQTVRNAVKSGLIAAEKTWLGLSVDQFGNTTANPVLYIDPAAITSWKNSPDFGKNRGGRRGDGLTAVTLRVGSDVLNALRDVASGTALMVTLSTDSFKLIERKPGSRPRKAKNGTAPVAPVEQSDLFDVEV